MESEKLPNSNAPADSSWAAKRLFQQSPGCLLNALSFCIGVALALVLLTYIKALQHDIVVWRTVVVSRIGVAVFSCFIFSALFWLSFSAKLWGRRNVIDANRSTILAQIVSVISYGAVSSGVIGSFLLSFAPAPNHYAADQRQVIPVFPANEAPPLIAYVILFDNGSAKISPTQQQALREFLKPIKRCPGHRVVAQGFASSARYVSNNEELNLQLAYQRLNAVKAIGLLESVGIQDAARWSSLSAMNSRLIMKDGLDETRFLEREPFNRRVELTIQSLGECQIKPNPASSNSGR
jgi:outer membrane protein OmpA-like peptidoglycan-associated protein